MKSHDLARMEAHLNARRIPGWKVAVYGFIVSCLLAGHLSYAASSGSTCGKSFSKTHYSAVFKMDAQDYRFVIGSEARGGAVQGVLIKTDAGGKAAGCQAVCDPQTFEKRAPSLRQDGSPLPREYQEPVAFQLECRSAKFPAFATITTLVWGSTRSRAASKAPVLRFGTWLNGYRSVPLTVESDTYFLEGPANLEAEKSLAAK